MIARFQGFTTTPFGWTPDSILQQVINAAGIYVNRHDDWAILSEDVVVEKEVLDSKGNAELKVSTISIPVRLYNFELHFLKTGSLSEAIRLTTNEYLPEKYGFSSYSAMIASFKDKYKDQSSAEWEIDIIPDKAPVFTAMEDAIGQDH